MKRIAVLLVACAQLAAAAETVIGPTTPTNRILIATNQSILITTESLVSLVAGGVTNVLGGEFMDAIPAWGRPDVLLAGPAEIVLGDGGLITFYRMTNTGLVSVFLTSTNPVPITIATNKTLQFLYSTWGFSATFQRGTVSVNLGQYGGFDTSIMRKLEMAGPGTLFLSLPEDTVSSLSLVSYAFSEDAVVVPGSRVLQGPTGTFEIGVDKSFDLTNWTPVVAHTTSDFPQAFYRLRIQR